MKLTTTLSLATTLLLAGLLVIGHHTANHRRDIKTLERQLFRMESDLHSARSDSSDAVHDGWQNEADLREAEAAVRTIEDRLTRLEVASELRMAEPTMENPILPNIKTHP